MKSITKTMLFSVALFTLSTANAENAYLGASYHLGTYDETDFPEANPNSIKIKAGNYIAENIAIEGHLLFGADSDTITYFGVDVEVELKNVLSVFAKGDIPVSESSNFYGLLGFSKGKLEASALGITVSEDDSGLSYGLGLETEFGDDMYFSGEYVLYISESEYDYGGFNFGFHKLF